MGNLGFSKTICDSTYIGINQPKGYGCRVGTITNLYASGLIGYETSLGDNLDLYPEFYFSYCDIPSNVAFDSTVDECSANAFNSTGLQADF